MKTYVLANRLSLDDLRVEERPAPTPGPRDLLLRMRAASLNFRDLAIARGEYGPARLPLVPLSDGAGEVVAVGREVRRFAVGDLVCPVYIPDWIDGPAQEATSARRLGGSIDGVGAELYRVHEEAAVRAPAHLGPEEAATLPIAAVTVWQALFEGALARAGDSLAVRGSGGVSLFVLQLARAAGLRVLSVSRGGDNRRARLERLGAEVIDGADSAWPERVRAATGGRGADLFVDVVGGGGLGDAVAATKVGGTVVLVGFVGGTTAPLDLVTTIRRATTLKAVSGGSRTSFEAVGRFMERHAVRPVVDRTFSFPELRAAYDHLATGRPFGKVVLRFDASGGGTGP